MPVFVVHGTDASITSIGAPTYQQVQDALATIQLFGPNGEIGGWVGPRPRVTRSINTGAPRAWLLHVAWPYGWPDAPAAGLPDARVQQQLLDAVRRQLSPLSSDWTISLEPYAPAVNGPLASWQSGALSVTQTADIWPTAGGRLDAQENPVGPTTPGTHPGTLAEAGRSTLTGVTEALKAIWPLAALGLGVYVADRLGAFRPAPKKRMPRELAIPRGAVANPDYSRINPRPAEWLLYPPSTPYPCKPWESGILGLRVPGRRGGVVTACATPAEPVSARRRRGQVQIGLPGIGGTMPKSRARARIRRAGLAMLRTPIEDVAQAVDAYGRSTCPLPYAPGLEFPHTVSRCDPEHSLWRGFQDALADAQEHASMVLPESAGREEFECGVREALSTDPRFPMWDAAAQACARGFESREASRKGKAAFSSQRERGQARASAIARGEDVSGAEYRDTLRSAERKGGKRR